MGKHQRFIENLIHGIFLFLGLVTVGCVLLITVYLILSGIPAIRQIGLLDFLLGDTWESTAKEPSFGILPFILTSIYGTAGAILFGVPVGFFTAVYLAKLAPPKVKAVVESAVSLLAGIPSVVYGLVGMLVLVPGIRQLFHVPDGASLLAAIIVLAIMILPSIIKVSVTALEAVPQEYEDASLALGATPIETYFRVSAPAAKSGIAAAVVLGVGRAIGEAMAVMMVSGNVPNMPSLFQSVRFLTTAVASEMAYSSGLQRQALFSIALVLYLFVLLLNAALNFFLKRKRRADHAKQLDHDQTEGLHWPDEGLDGTVHSSDLWNCPVPDWICSDKGTPQYYLGTALHKTKLSGGNDWHFAGYFEHSLYHRSYAADCTDRKSVV